MPTVNSKNIKLVFRSNYLLEEMIFLNNFLRLFTIYILCLFPKSELTFISFNVFLGFSGVHYTVRLGFDSRVGKNLLFDTVTNFSHGDSKPCSGILA